MLFRNRIDFRVYPSSIYVDIYINSGDFKYLKRIGEVKYHKLFIQTHTTYSDIKIKDFKTRESIYMHNW